MQVVDFDKLCEMFWDGNFMEIHKDDIPSIPSAFEGMTNGEVIKAVFPDNPIDVFIHDVNIRDRLNVVAHFDLEWWNAPYKANKEEEECREKKQLNG